MLRKPKGNYSTKSHRRAPKHERELEKRIGGRRTKGSGNQTRKGDVENETLLVEAKSTKNLSFSIKRELIEILEGSAQAEGKIPVVRIEFLNGEGNPVGGVCVIPDWALERLK